MTSTAIKRTKRLRDETDDVDIDTYITARRQEFVKKRKEVDSLMRKASALRDEASRYTRRFEWRRKMDCLEHAKLLEDEAEMRRSMRREHDYEARVVTYLQTHHAVKSSPQYTGNTRTNRGGALACGANAAAAEVADRRKAILDEFLIETHRAPPNVAMAARDVCPRCTQGGDVQLILNQVKSTMACPQCGYAVTYLDATSTSTSFDETVEFSQYSYKRVNHYMLWLALVQGKEAHKVSDAVLESVMWDLYERQHVRSCSDVTHAKVRTALRRQRLRKAYDHVVQITSRISGRPPPRISAQTETLMRNMFLSMQIPFQRHAPGNRTNFLSYPYVLYRCFQIIGMDHMLDGLALLKGRDKLEANDAIFRKMCEDLGWPVFALPP